MNMKHKPVRAVWYTSIIVARPPCLSALCSVQQVLYCLFLLLILINLLLKIKFTSISATNISHFILMAKKEPPEC